jgi:hypothetical protein
LPVYSALPSERAYRDEILATNVPEIPFLEVMGMDGLLSYFIF